MPKSKLTSSNWWLKSTLLLLLQLLVVISPVNADNTGYQGDQYTANTYGGIGLLQIPSARFSQDGEFAFGLSHETPFNRLYGRMQFLPWFEGVVRYTEGQYKAYYPGSPQTFKDKGIDVKVKIFNEKDKKLRNDHLKKHIDRVKDHIKSLSKKNYNKIHNLKSFQYVIMFMPFDTCYLSVLEHDDEIIEFTHQHKVILAGPISIMALIANVTSMKNQQKQLSIVENIVFSAEKVYDKYKVVKDNIRTLVSSFKTHKNSVEGLINNVYGSKKGLENLIKKLKDDHGLNPGSTIVESTEADKVVGDIDDPEEKKVVNYKK